MGWLFSLGIIALAVHDARFRKVAILATLIGVAIFAMIFVITVCR
jgi:hypothetical protein